ncbi:MAG: phosphotransferase family protein [Steroidobacteraceae bacterium]
MQPRDQRLLQGVRRTLAQLSQRLDSNEPKAVLQDVDLVLNELLLRSDHRFYTDHYRDGLALAREGAALESRFRQANTALMHGALEQLAPVLDEALSTDAIGTAHEALRRVMEDIVRRLANSPVSTEPETRSYLDRIVDWENRYHARHWTPAEAPGTESHTVQTSRYTRDDVERYLRSRFPERRALAVRDVKVLPGGFSKRTLLMDVVDEVEGEHSLVIRAEQPPRFDFWQGDQVKNEFVVLQLVHEAGLPVAEPLWLELDTAQLGQAFLASRRARGSNAGSSIGASGKLSEKMVESLVSTLARIHNTRINRQDERLRRTHLREWAQYATMAEATTAWVAHWFDCVEKKQLAPSPSTVRLMEWLRNNVPPTEDPPVLLHGDYGLHNTLFENEHVSCVLDWEYTSFGDPAEDIAMLCISLGDSVDRERIAALYARCGGLPISKYRLRYFDVLYCMKFIVPCENALKLFADHADANIGLCRLGLLYPFPAIKDMNDKIALAEEAKGR